MEEDLTNTGTTETPDSTFETPPGQATDDDTITGDDIEEDGEETSIIDSPSNATGVYNTPRTGGTVGKARTRSPPPSNRSLNRVPYRARDLSQEPSTPRTQTVSDRIESSPFDPPSAYNPSTAQRRNPDPLLHRVLDKNYRVQATPHTGRKEGYQGQKEQRTPATATKRSAAFESSPLDSSPAAPPPQLRSDLFSPAPPSAIKSRAKAQIAPRTPGISVQHTPGQKLTSAGREIFTGNRASQSNLTARTPALWDSDSEEEDDFGGMSPPKTMQFAIPQSRLLQTPAREASRQIVNDLLLTAGAEATDEIEGIGDGEYVEEVSPSVVKRAWEDDDTF